MKKLVLLLILMLMVSFSSIQPAQAINNQQINASVQVLCPDGDSNWFSGSGTMIDSSGIVMTNRHVVTDSNGYIINSCYVGVTKSISVAPSFDYVAEVKYWATDADMDVAFLYIDNQANELFSAIDVFAYDTNNLNLGDSLEVVGYPSIGNSTLTYVNGVVSGFSGNYIKSTAPIDQGNSGGSAYNSQGYFVGIPSAVQLGVANSISYILNINNVKDWLIQTFGSDYQADLYGASATSNINENIIEQQSDITSPNTDAVYGWVYTDSSMNTALTFEQTESDSNPYFIWDGFTDDSGIAGYYVYFGFDFNARPIEEGMLVTSNKYYGKADKGDGEYYLLVQAKDNSGNVSNTIYWTYNYQSANSHNIILEPITDSPVVINYDPYELDFPQATLPGALAQTLSGRILLQVERNGEAWYVYPNNNKRYFLNRPADAFTIMRELGLGATHQFISSYSVYPKHVWGKILLDVEKNGEAYYIYPITGRAYYLGRPADAFRIMRELGLGITNQNLAKIPFDFI
ncbi:hypothetical protein A2533_03125 [Candidatus Falkowbacteria bacterium RIFOXYD2_FULL_35_9]|uniref:Serine protease n=1 Tax=Candidatus Falkowbacteria bacterium RIFOXYC2_FULL_36_12 TaxID=1798002 RepID=A0A1F5SVY0_9BACT|nr:MAG: hypothetical protein A2478_00330 [Candidatus Falkowbacteria bacterium RIFOXYC2_FULL_36_12]OGF31464.1 MAG: hypothetical protein A2300_00130 [Candidatus Falkowbacteria bacterium RIFOXYB2_FULL_35_7]OGF46965.1 MAG: hypothetical protein A2533_03125 [Candidatus Falkowbacteria bacterium RIFOXYD2_FULL_35_9]